MSIVQIIMISGAMCVSAVDHQPNTTTAYKVPCAIIVNDNGGETVLAKDQSRISAAPPAKKKAARVSSCKKRWYWKGGRKKWRCVRR